MVGEYRILRSLGAGGMGMVYLAQRGDAAYTQTVALKVVKKGMDSEEILRRFELERKLLSSLDHPNIARLLDGGTTEDGRPYFALEYVDGQPIDRYCDAHRLSTRERLVLFRKVCAAVHYAHQNLIVHRDLKPGNVLITSRGEPKLLDFGIAKLLNPELFQSIAVTGPTIRLMTPEYASPEQVRGDPITTSSDIYSLGVMLYELLTGRRPYKFKTRLQQEILRIVCEEPPERPSTVITRADEQPEAEGKTRRVEPSTVAETREGDVDKLRRRLRGDIDDIVLKAIEKAPARRYASAEQFAEDIHRHLTGEPVIARPPSITYRAGKFVQRNRVKVGAAAGVALALILGLVGTGVQWARAEHARDAAEAAQAEEAAQRAAAEKAQADEAAQRAAAEAAADIAEQSYKDTWDVLTSYITDVHAAVAPLPGSVAAREIIVDTASKKMQSLAERWKTDDRKQLLISTSFERLGQLASDIRGGSQGNTAKALGHQQRALDMRRRLAEATPDNEDYQLALATSHVRIGDLQTLTRDRPAAITSYETARAVFEKYDGEGPEHAQARTRLASTLGQLADLERDAGDLAAAQPLYERADALRRALRDLAVAQAAAPGMDEKQSRAAAAAALTARRNVTVGQFDLANVRVERGDVDGALPIVAEALDERRAILDAEPTQARTRRDLAVGLILSSEVFSRAGRHADAIREADEAVAIMSALTASEVERPDARNIATLAHARLAAADAVRAAAAPDAPAALETALRSYRAAATLFAERLAADADNADLQRPLAEARSGESDCLLRLARAGDAVEPADAGVSALRSLAQRSPDDLFLARVFSMALRRDGSAHAALAADESRPPDERRRERDAAETSLREALSLANRVAAAGLRTADPADEPAAIETLLRNLPPPP
jgi:tetratricopeptide (TPR) repeat protein